MNGILAAVRRIAAVLVAAVLAAVASCAEQPDGGDAPRRARVTPGDAAGVFRAFVATDDVARASGDERLALSLVANGQRPIVASEYRRAAFAQEQVTRYHWGQPTLWVPRLSAYPLWFAMAVQRRTGTDERTAVLVFTRADARTRWQLGSMTLIELGAALPDVAVDDRGYATRLTPGDPSLAVSPSVVGALQATVVEEGPESPAAKVVAAGPHTTARFAQIKRERQRAKLAGLAYEWTFNATRWPIYALRTRDGGAVVWYTLTRGSSWFARSANVYRIEVPPGASHLLDRLVIRRQLEVQETLQYTATVPAKHAVGQIRIVGHDGDITKATGI